MDFTDSPAEARFRGEVRQWLANNATPLSGRSANAGVTVADGADLAKAKAWQQKKSDAGYVGFTVAKEYGGRGGGAIEQVIYRQEEAAFDVPFGVFEIGLGMCVPTVISWGSEAHRKRYVPRALAGQEIWCQLFSEPAGGSDIAALRTRAERSGDHWIINGQKVWTSGAHYCDFGILLVRTDPDVPKHKGLTMFIVDMKSPGVEVRPIRTMAGAAEFNEVFFTDVRIADSDRLGDVGEGWRVAISTLMHERMHAGSGFGFLGWKEILSLARAVDLEGSPALKDARVRERIADYWLNEQALRLLSSRAQTALSQGAFPGPEQSVNKAVEASQGQQAAYFAMDLLGESGALLSSARGDDRAIIEKTWLWASAMRIAGGSDEILRNIIAERVLGLPGDARLEKDTPFNKLPA